MQRRLIFLIGSPRSGTTLLQRMIGSHSRVFAPAEPHLITPLAHLGVFHNVEKAPYDHLNASVSQKQFIEQLPGGEADYLDACRAYTDHLYLKRLEAAEADLLLEKTPAYALVPDFLTRLYPKAHYVVLTRHPLAIWSSFAQSFFEGDYREAHKHNRLLERYVPAIAWILREKPVDFIQVRYEDLVTDPENEILGICDHLELNFEKGMIEYGWQRHDTSGRGDPVTVDQKQRPTTDSMDKWVRELAADPDKAVFARELIDYLDDGDLKLWGYPKAELLAPLDQAVKTAALPKPPLNRFRLERLLVLGFRKRIRRGGFFKRLVEKIRFLADVLLRE